MSRLDIEFGEDFLDEIKEWIADKYEIDELYDNKRIVKWIDGNYAFIIDNYNIDDLYEKEDIEEWLISHAKDYGYVEEE